ncbi:hypothetical protein MtrunA17_Chr3g0125271 [Medicago truncatula]|uniref:Nodule Cysteine-Rich (NCR) secreted peptide n=1 Tax=Medicago truncatula TaxID=3880 RepID=A0A396J2N1_MEDTR|nr:hypothetical protein MtrunA17_Chr3g0125271 [Medicago truncatula]
MLILISLFFLARVVNFGIIAFCKNDEECLIICPLSLIYLCSNNRCTCLKRSNFADLPPHVYKHLHR